MIPEELKAISEFVLNLKQKVKCAICLDFIEHVVEFDCSHRFCSSCITEHTVKDPNCPICNVAISKRFTPYKDPYTDEFSKTVRSICQVLKEKYACEVEELAQASETKLQEIIDRAPEDMNTDTDVDDPISETSSSSGSTSKFEAPCQSEFDQLIGIRRKTYQAKKGQIQHGNRPVPKASLLNNILTFENDESRRKIISWLNDNQRNLNILTQSPSFLEPNTVVSDSEMPSISQVSSKSKQKQCDRIRSQSLTIDKQTDLPEPLVRRYQSLTEGLDLEIEDYNIEEEHSMIIKQAERKVLQDMLEDECLATLDKVAEEVEANEKAKSTKEKSSKETNREKSPKPGCSGWNRINEVKKTLKKASKEPKKLKINVLDTSLNIKKSPTGPFKISPQHRYSKTKKKISPEIVKKQDNKENETNMPKINPEDNQPKNNGHSEEKKQKNVFNLSTNKCYYNMDKVKPTIDKNTSSDMEEDTRNPRRVTDASKANIKKNLFKNWDANLRKQQDTILQARNTDIKEKVGTQLDMYTNLKKIDLQLKVNINKMETKNIRAPIDTYINENVDTTQKENEYDKVKDYSNSKVESVDVNQTNKKDKVLKVHINKIIMKDKKDMENVNLSTNKNKDLVNLRAENKNKIEEKITNQNANFDDDIFLQATQTTEGSVGCHITPVPPLDDFDVVVQLLSENLQNCIANAHNFSTNSHQTLSECFANLNTYADRMKYLRSKVQQPAVKEVSLQTSQTSKLVSNNNKSVGVQASIKSQMPEKREIVVQTSPIQKPATFNVEVQTLIKRVSDQNIQTEKEPVEERVEKCVQTSQKSLRLSSPKGNTDNNISIKSPKKPNNKNEELLKRDAKLTSAKNSSVGNSQKIGDKQAIKAVDVSENKSKKTTQDSVLMCSITLPSKCSNNGFSQNRKHVRHRYKRIRSPVSDSDSDDTGRPSKKKFMKDDLTVLFRDSENTAAEVDQVKEDNAKTRDSDSDFDHEAYLLEVMARLKDESDNEKTGTKSSKLQITPKEYKPSGSRINSQSPTRQNSSRDNQKMLQSSKNTVKKCVLKHVFQKHSQISPKTKETQKRSHKLTENSQNESQKKSYSGDHVFTAQGAFEENMQKFEKEICDFEQNFKAHSTECDVVENTPILSPEPKMPRLHIPIKKKSQNKEKLEEPLQILSKGSASSGNIILPLKEDGNKSPIKGSSSEWLSEKEPSTLNRNIEQLESTSSRQRERSTVDVAGLLADLKDDEDFFNTNMETDEQDHDVTTVKVDKIKMSETFKNGGQCVDDLPDNVGTSVKLDKEKINVTQENIDKVLDRVLNAFEGDDDDLDAELERISFTAEQKKSPKNIAVLQNVTLKSPVREDVDNSENDIIDASSDEEIVESTPPKDVSKRHVLENVVDDKKDEDLDVFLPPPPGFGDDQSPKENDRVSEMIVSPETNKVLWEESKREQNFDNTQQSLTFNSFITPKKPNKDTAKLVHSTPRASLNPAASEGRGGFSPIQKCSLNLSQAQQGSSPLVSSTLRLSTKKPTNLMTSTPNQKSILNYIGRASQESVPVPAQRSKPCIMWTRMIGKDMNIFTKLEVRKLLTISRTFNPEVTHLVVLVDEKGQIKSHTAKYLLAVAAGRWVVRFEWVEDCLKANRILPEEPYEALDISGVAGPKISRLTRTSNPLFAGYRFYCAPPFSIVSKVEIENALEMLGGEVVKELEALQRDEKTNIILTDTSATEDMEQFETWLENYKIVTVDVEWLTKCIGQYKLVSFRPYLLCSDDTICDLGYPSTLVESVPFTLTEDV